MGSTHITPKQKDTLLRLVRERWTIKDAASQAGVSYAWAKNFIQEIKVVKPDAISTTKLAPIGPPKPYHTLTPVARDCLQDFGRFRGRYFGRHSSPWQEDAAERVRVLLESDQKEYVVVNCPPGSGKSTLFTHDIPIWLTCRSRTIRGFIGSNTQRMANYYTRRTRNTLARAIPMQASTEDLEHGLARDADTTVSHDYGFFRPTMREVPWAGDHFTVEQIEETPVGEKEATWAAFGMDSEFLGYRVNIIVWDDLVVADMFTSKDAADRIEKQRKWWHDEAETRLEPGGLLILQGQRLNANDLYRYCLDLETGIEELDDHYEDIGERVPHAKKYHHIVYKAHYEEVCQAAKDPTVHRITAPAFNKDGTGGCLLDPARLSWRELKGVMARPLSNFRVVYQQEDVDPAEVLVPKLWITGGEGDGGEEFPGCLDYDRELAQIPSMAHGTVLSVLTVDPSPTKYWSIQWWLYSKPDYLVGEEEEHPQPHIGFRYLIDHFRDPMQAPDLLDWNVAQNRWTGLLEDWWHRARALGQPFTHVIMERDGQQRFLSQYDYFRNWFMLRNVILIGHVTSHRKTDPEYGIWMLKPHYRYGRIRLPYKGPEARRQSDFLIRELTTYPGTDYDDCIMANWFLEFQLQFLDPGLDEVECVYDDMPSWLGQEPSFIGGL